MILLISEKQEIVQKVADYITLLGQESIILTPESQVTLKNLAINESATFTLIIDGKKVTSQQIKAVWFRRSSLHLNHLETITSLKNQWPEMYKHLVKEQAYLIHYLDSLLVTNFPSIGSPFNSEPDKLKTLELARKAGLEIPSSHVISSKEQLNSILNPDNEMYITKSIKDLFVHVEKGTLGFSYTSMLTEEAVKQCGQEFFPTLIQKQIQRKYELRVIYLQGTFYPIAMFPQNKQKTKEDIRNYSHNKPNRIIHCALPKETEEQLQHLMNEMKVNFASIDMIVTPNDEYYFLEVNPNGQYSGIAHESGIDLDYQIAKLLIQKSNEKEDRSEPREKTAFKC